jgi:O-methyltransferase involved in polyketide biosynthesis
MWGVLTPHQFLPDVIALRRQSIPDHERQTCLVGSLLNQDWLEQVNVREKALFIAAGVRQP